MILLHKKYLPSFGILDQDQAPVCLYTVLSINESVGDCAAYEGIGPTMNGASEAEQQALFQRIRGGGMKIPESLAKELFPEIEDMGLRYRL